MRSSSLFAFAALILLTAPAARAQTFDFDGFVKTAAYYDTRQGTVIRGGDVYLFPNRELDPDRDDDPGDQDNLLLYPFFSRIGVTIAGLPEAFGAQVDGRIETDFYGPSNATNNTLRLRRGFVRMAWEGREVLVGMEWSPLTTNAVPGTVGTTAGRPFQTFARQPQVRLTLRPSGAVTLIGALSQQVDAFAEQGEGGAKQHQRAGIPAATALAEITGASVTVGVGAHIKQIVPLLTGDRIKSGHGQVYAVLTQPTFTVRAKAMYGENLADFVMPGGYFVGPGPEDGTLSYLPTRLISGWVDAETLGAISVGIFAGYFEQLGTRDTFRGDPRFAHNDRVRAANIADQWRIAPRAKLRSGPVQLGFEAEITSALYASSLDEDLRPDPTDDDERVGNLRLNIALVYFF